MSLHPAETAATRDTGWVEGVAVPLARDQFTGLAILARTLDGEWGVSVDGFTRHTGRYRDLGEALNRIQELIDVHNWRAATPIQLPPEVALCDDGWDQVQHAVRNHLGDRVHTQEIRPGPPGKVLIDFHVPACEDWVTFTQLSSAVLDKAVDRVRCAPHGIPFLHIEVLPGGAVLRTHNLAHAGQLRTPDGDVGGAGQGRRRGCVAYVPGSRHGRLALSVGVSCP